MPSYLPTVLCAGALALTTAACRQNTAPALAPTSVDYPYTVAVASADGLAFDVLDPTFLTLVDTAAGIEVLARGFDWSEGPAWVPALDALLFTDVPQNVVYRWRAGGAPLDPADATGDAVVVGVDTFLYPSGYWDDPRIVGEAGANGLWVANDGALLLAQSGSRRVGRYRTALAPDAATLTAAGGDFDALAERFGSKRFNSPNDLVQGADGTIYFTDPPYGVDKTFGEAARELDFSGVYRVRPGGEPELLLDSLPRPNGIALTPDGDRLIVSNAERTRELWLICDLQAGGPPSACRTFADATAAATDANPGNNDGMAMRADGVLFATGPGGVWCFSASGQHLGTIRTGSATSNVALGGTDGRSVFITADDRLLRARLR